MITPADMRGGNAEEGVETESRLARGDGGEEGESRAEVLHDVRALQAAKE